MNGTQQVKVYTDHINLSLYKKSTIPLTKRATRLAEFILANNNKIHYIPGENSIMADTLSRLPQH